jgi:hypothetical protein
MRLAALRALRAVGKSAWPALPALKGAAEHDADARVRRLASEILGLLGEDK